MAHSIGKTIAELRKEKGWTQVELAEKLQVSDKAVSKWEKDDAFPSVEFFPTLAELFGVSIDYIMTGKVESVNLDDMDATKRMFYLIERDDAENYVKYGHTKTTYFDDFPRGTDKTAISSIISNNSIKIFKACVAAGIQLKPRNYGASTFVGALYEHIDELIKIACLAGSVEFLEKINVRSFAIGDKTSQLKNNSSVKIIHSNFNHTYDSKTAFLMNLETFNFIFDNPDIPEEIIKYISTYVPFDSKKVKQSTSIADFGRIDGVFYFLEQSIIECLYVSGRYELLDAYLKAVAQETNKTITVYQNRNAEYDRGNYHLSYKVVPSGYLIRSDTGSYGQTTILGKVTTISRKVIEFAASQSDKEWLLRFANYNRDLVNKVQNQFSLYVYLMTDAEIERKLLLHSDIPEKEKTVLRCIKDGIIISSEVKRLEDLTLVRTILNSAYYNYYEIACECYKNGNYRKLFELLVDLKCEDKARNLVRASNEERIDLVRKLFDFFATMENCLDKNAMAAIDREARKQTFGFDNRQNSPETRRLWGIEVEKYCIEKIYEYILEQKEGLYQHVKQKIDARVKAQREAEERANIVKGLDKNYFENLLLKNEVRLFVLDLCSLFDAILKYDYKCEGEDFFARMTSYFNNGPKSQDCDDGWGYMVLDTKHEEEVVKPWNNNREMFNRLRIQRNNIAHSESKPVKELNVQELRECLKFVFAINKEAK